MTPLGAPALGEPDTVQLSGPSCPTHVLPGVLFICPTPMIGLPLSGGTLMSSYLLPTHGESGSLRTGPLELGRGQGQYKRSLHEAPYPPLAYHSLLGGASFLQGSSPPSFLPSPGQEPFQLLARSGKHARMLNGQALWKYVCVGGAWEGAEAILPPPPEL